MVQEIKMYDRYKDFYVNDVVRTRIVKMFGYLGVQETDIKFLDTNDEFGNPDESCHYIAYKTYSGSLKQEDADAVMHLMMQERNWDERYRTIVVDMHDGKIMQCALNEYAGID